MMNALKDAPTWQKKKGNIQKMRHESTEIKNLKDAPQNKIDLRTKDAPTF